MRSRFYHIHIMYTRNWDGSCLLNLICFVLHIFQMRNLLHCVDESWWNKTFKEKRLDDGVQTMPLLCCYQCDCMQQHYEVTQFVYVLWRDTMQEWVMNIDNQTWIAHNPHPPRNNGACVVTIVTSRAREAALVTHYLTPLISACLKPLKRIQPQKNMFTIYLQT